MTTMQLRGTIIDQFDDERLASVDVISDTAEQWDKYYRRRIEGRIVAFGRAWDRFIGFWGAMNVDPVELDGISYIAVRNLQVDYDHYGVFSYLNVDNAGIDDVIRIAMMERFTGTEGEYYKQVRARNQRMENYLAKWDEGRITRNDVRELRGFPRRNGPHFNEYLSTEILAQVKASHLSYSDRTNLIV